jgi:hypothetical protein
MQCNSTPSRLSSSEPTECASVRPEISGGPRHILLGWPRRGQCLTKGADKKKAKKYIFKIINFILLLNHQTFNLYKSL